MSISSSACCQDCGYRFDAASAVAGDAEQVAAGYVSICLACGGLGFYVDSPSGLVIRPATDAEREELLADPQMIRIRLAIHEAASQDPNWPSGPTVEETR